jgi:hypothetical protein
MKCVQNGLKMLIVALIVTAVFVSSFADADETLITAKNDGAKSVVVSDFSWPACGGFCSSR